MSIKKFLILNPGEIWKERHGEREIWKEGHGEREGGRKENKNETKEGKREGEGEGGRRGRGREERDIFVTLTTCEIIFLVFLVFSIY